MAAMETIETKNWAEVKSAIAMVREKYAKNEIVLKNGDKILRPNRILFRGQSNAGWDLLTTLERASREEFTVERYMHYARECVHEIESFTNRKWDVKPIHEIRQELKDHGGDGYRCHLPHYDFLIYLRHHGFPFPRF